MKVQAIVKYFDTELGKVIKPTDKPYEVSEERAKELTVNKIYTAAYICCNFCI